ncbi:MAG: DNA polymerase III subunit delta [Actinobacteria bacterium]|nr:DNA polymerase III subunit delta [Actinomycetota bacterium]
MSSPVYLLTGDGFLVEEALDRVRREEATDPLSEATFDATVEVAELTNALGTASLFGDRRLVVVTEAGDLSKDAVRALEDYLGAPAPSTVLALTATGRTKLDGAVKKSGAVITLEAPRGRRLLPWIRARAGSLGLKLDDRAAWALIDAVGSALRPLHSALEQLATGLGGGRRVAPGGTADRGAGRVTDVDVRKAFPRIADEHIYALTDAVGDRRLPVAMTTLRRLLEQGEEPLVLFGALTGQVRRMLRARAVADGGARAVADAIGMPGWRAERLYRQSRSFKEEELVGALELLAETDVELKGGDLSPGAALERAVVGIVGGAHQGRI